MGFESLLGGGNSQVDPRFSHIYDSLITHADRVANEINKRLDTDDAVGREGNGVVVGVDQNGLEVEPIPEDRHRSILLEFPQPRSSGLDNLFVTHRHQDEPSSSQSVLTHTLEGSGMRKGTLRQQCARDRGNERDSFDEEQEGSSEGLKRREDCGKRDGEEGGEGSMQMKVCGPMQQSAWHGMGRESIIESVMSALDEDPYFSKFLQDSTYE